MFDYEPIIRVVSITFIYVLRFEDTFIIFISSSLNQNNTTHKCWD